MRKIILIALIFIACGKDKGLDKPTGYYYEKGGDNIYFFNNDKLFKYNFRDSLKTESKVVIEKDSIVFLDEKYRIIFSNSDSIGFLKKKNKLVLTSFELKNKIHDNIWVYDSDDEKSQQFLRKEKNHLAFYFKNKGDILAQGELKYPFEGRMFNKFDIYISGKAIIPLNYNENDLEILIYHLGFGFEFLSLKSYLSEKDVEFLFGSWSKIEKHSYNRLVDRFNLLNYNSGLPKSKSFLEKRNKHKKIEFSKNSLTYFFEKNKDSIKNTYKVSYPLPGYIFVDNPEYENQLLKLIRLENDTMIVEFSKPFKYRLVYIKNVNRAPSHK